MIEWFRDLSDWLLDFADSDLAVLILAISSFTESGNQVPVLNSIGAKGTTEGVNLNFAVSATDADGTLPTLTATALPTGATYLDNGDGTGTFDWTPNFTQSANHCRLQSAGRPRAGGGRLGGQPM